MNETEIENKFCPHCPHMESMGLSHTKVCKCGCPHLEHNFGGGCLKCKDCDRYDQTDPVVREPKAKVIVLEVSNAALGALVAEVLAKKQTSHTTLVAAQSRVDLLRARAHRPTAGQSPD